MLWRALRHVSAGFYVDVGAGDPVTDSVTKAFYDAGWSGVNIEPSPIVFQRLEEARGRDVNLQLAIADEASEAHPFFLIGEDTGLDTIDHEIAKLYATGGMKTTQVTVETSTLATVFQDHAPTDIHFLKVDVEGAELLVLRGADFKRWRPWIVVVEATKPNSLVESHHLWEPTLLQNGYNFVYFDGLNRFYIAIEHEDELARSFDRPPNWFDHYIGFNEHKLLQNSSRWLGHLKRNGFPENALSKGRLEVDDRLVFVHITKTAGTSANRAIQALFKNEESLHEKTGFFRQIAREELSKYRYYCVHANIEDLICIPKPFKIVTFLRNPIERLISSYEHCSSYTETTARKFNMREAIYCRSLSLEECLLPEREIQFSFQWNPYVCALAGWTNRHEHEQELLGRALEVLNALNFVGISEDLRSSFEMMSTKFDVPNLYTGERLNVTSQNKDLDPSMFSEPRKIDFSARLFELIRERVSLDMVLYRHAVRLLFGDDGVARTHLGTVGDGGRLRVGKDRSWIESVNTGGFLLIGPYLRLFPGRYRVVFQLRFRSANEAVDRLLATLDVVGELGTLNIAARPVKLADFKEKDEKTVYLEFELSRTLFDVEFRLYNNEASEISVARDVLLYEYG